MPSTGAMMRQWSRSAWARSMSACWITTAAWACSYSASALSVSACVPAFCATSACLRSAVSFGELQGGLGALHFAGALVERGAINIRFDFGDDVSFLYPRIEIGAQRLDAAGDLAAHVHAHEGVQRSRRRDELRNVALLYGHGFVDGCLVVRTSCRPGGRAAERPWRRRRRGPKNDYLRNCFPMDRRLLPVRFLKIAHR